MLSVAKHNDVGRGSDAVGSAQEPP